MEGEIVKIGSGCASFAGLVPVVFILFCFYAGTKLFDKLKILGMDSLLSLFVSVVFMLGLFFILGPIDDYLDNYFRELCGPNKRIL